MEQKYIHLTDRDRHFLSILFALTGYLANGLNYVAAINLSMEAADNLVKRTQTQEVDEQ